MSEKNYTVGEVFGQEQEIRTYMEDRFWVLPSTMIGVEVEIEGCRTNPVRNNKLWTLVEDNSLRPVDGINPFELRFSLPLCGKDLTDALNVYEQGLEKLPAPPVFSERTSVHVHLDVREMNLHHILKFIILYTVFERSFFRFCGKHRENNVFTLPFYSAEGRVFSSFSVETLTDPRLISHISGDNYRYSALNFASLSKFGTLEFRHMEGTSDVQRIRNWINIIMCLKKEVLTNTHIKVKEFPRTFSQKGLINYTQDIFGNYFQYLNAPELQMEIIEGIRLAQDIIYKDNLSTISHYINSQLNTEEIGESLQKYAKTKNKVFKPPRPSVRSKNEELLIIADEPEEIEIEVHEGELNEALDRLNILHRQIRQR